MTPLLILFLALISAGVFLICVWCQLHNIETLPTPLATIISFSWLLTILGIATTLGD